MKYLLKFELKSSLDSIARQTNLKKKKNIFTGITGQEREDPTNCWVCENKAELNFCRYTKKFLGWAHIGS